MTRFLTSTVLAAALLSIAGAASAQVVFENAAGDLNEDLLDAIEDDAERDLDRFGNVGRTDGFTGSLALRATATDDASEAVDVGIGADLGYLAGPNGYELQLNYRYSDSEEASSTQRLFYTGQYTRDLSPRLFGFAKLQGSVEEFTDEAERSDTFLSFGAGYRVLDTSVSQWTVQAGIGYRYANFGDVDDVDFSEPAVGLSSDYARQISETLYITNDTDVIASDDIGTTLINDLALSVAMTDTLALRTSLLTKYDSETAEGLDDTTNTLGVSVVFSF